MKSDFDRVLELAGEAAVLRYYLGAAADYADGGHVPPPETVARWRELAGREAGGVEVGVGVEGLHGAGEEVDHD